jgi:hypothetical protein
MNGCELKRAMQEDGVVGEVDPLAKCNQAFMSSSLLRGV